MVDDGLLPIRRVDVQRDEAQQFGIVHFCQEHLRSALASEERFRHGPFLIEHVVNAFLERAAADEFPSQSSVRRPSFPLSSGLNSRH